MTHQWFESFREWRETLDARLGQMEAVLRRLAEGRPTEEHFTAAEFARLVDRSEYTVREWARLGRLCGEKTHARCSWPKANVG